jgi:hypothetical protein
VPDTHECASWYRDLVARVPAFSVLYSASSRERRVFSAHGVETRTFPRRFSFHAGSIREALARGDEGHYRPALTSGALAVLDRIGAAARLRELEVRDRAASGREG